MKRHKDAIAIQQGACNPSAIAIAIQSAVAECRAEKVTPTEDPAVRLMAHQLAYICNTLAIDEEQALYSYLIEACEGAANAQT